MAVPGKPGIYVGGPAGAPFTNAASDPLGEPTDTTEAPEGFVQFAGADEIGRDGPDWRLRPSGEQVPIEESGEPAAVDNR